MQVPEKLSLIGGSILLASTLIFTLKGQASSILPKVDNGMSEMFKSDKERQDDQQKQSQTQADQAFNSNFQQAQQKGWQTGNWGTAKFYVDDQHNMYIGSGELQGILRDVVGMDKSNALRTVNFTGDVKAPRVSDSLLQANMGDNYTLQEVNGLEHMDTSQTINLGSLFSNDQALTSINGIKDWDTTNVTNIRAIFIHTASLKHLDLSGWHTPNLKATDFMLANDISLQSLDISNFDTSQASMDYSFGGAWPNSYVDNLRQINLGNKTYLKDGVGIPNITWQNGNQSISSDKLQDANIHPGTWTGR